MGNTSFARPFSSCPAVLSMRQRPHAKPRRPRPAPPTRAAEHAPQRLQKVMAAAGVGSRRHCEELITSGRVEVDRRVVDQLGAKVDPDSQEVRVDGQPLKLGRRAYFLVHKPVGVVSTNHDPAGRPRVIDLLPPSGDRLFTVGRLDLSSEGLILVTNDGELANRLAHPRYGVEKTYHVLVAGLPGPEVLAQLKHGVHLAEAFARVVSVRVRHEYKQSTLLEIVLNEGRNREIRRLLARVGHKVLRLKRVALGGVRLKDLPPGEFRRLTNDELRELRFHSRPSARQPSESVAPTEPAVPVEPAAPVRPASQPGKSVVARGASPVGGNQPPVRKHRPRKAKWPLRGSARKGRQA